MKQCCRKCKNFKTALAIVARNIALGKFPFPDLLTDSFLIGIWKDPEHTKIRPIAIANNLSKLLITAAWKTGMKYINANQLTQMNQFGVSTSCGAEIPGFMIREYYRSEELYQTISLDITNAFNSIDRVKMLNKVKEKVPTLLPMVRLLYLHDSRLTLPSGEVILSQQGVRQGCPLSPLLFSLTIDEVLEEENRLASELGVQVVAYLDDHTFIQTRESQRRNPDGLTLRTIIDRIQNKLSELNLTLNEQKCTVFKPNYLENPPISQDEERITKRDGTTILGIPIGEDIYIQQSIQNALKDKMSIMNLLDEFPTQIAYHMLRLTIAPTPIYLARALGDDPTLFQQWDFLAEKTVFKLAGQEGDYYTYFSEERENFEEDTRERIIQEIQRRRSRRDITLHSRERVETARELIHLSSREGGLGITLTQKISVDAFLASSLNSIAILQEKGIHFTMSEKTARFFISNQTKLSHEGVSDILNNDNQLRHISTEQVQGLQNRLTKSSHKACKDQIEIQISDTPEWGLFQDHQGDHANRILIKPPTLAETFVVEDSCMKEIISQTLLLPNEFDFHTCHAKTGDQHNINYSNHMNACSYTGMVGIRHTTAKFALEKVCRILDITIRNEQKITREGTNYRADIYAPEMNTVLDVTCVQTTNYNRDLHTAMKNAYKNKVTLYNRMRNQAVLLPEFQDGCKIIPVVIGPRGQVLKRSLKDLTAFLGIPDPFATKLELQGVAPILPNRTDPEKALLAISLLKALSFRVAVDTARCALEWQRMQKEYRIQSAIGSRQNAVNAR